MKSTLHSLSRSLALAATLASAGGLFAANQTLFYDRNGGEPGSGVTSGGAYLWNITDSFWNSAAAGDESGFLTNWLDAAELGLTPGTTAAAQNTWGAHFSAGSPAESYTVTVPDGERRDIFYIVARAGHVGFSGAIRPQGINTYSTGFQAYNGSTLTISNTAITENNCHFVVNSGANFAGLIRYGGGVRLGFKQYSVQNYGTLDLGPLLDQNLIFTTNYPGGGRIANLFINGGDNNIVQGSGVLTVPLASWYFGPFPSFAWNQGGGGFAGRGGKLTVNFWGDGRTVTWAGADNFVAGGANLVLNSYYADNEVEFQNGIDLNGGMRKVKVLTALNAGAAGANSFATISGVISDSLGAGGLIKETQNAYQASGTLVLSGANTYSGPTEVREGKLVITPAHQGGGDFTVSDNATLGVRVTAPATVPMSALTLGGGASGALEINYCAASTVAPIRATNFVVLGFPATLQVGGQLTVGQRPLVQYEGLIGGYGFDYLVLTNLPAGVAAQLVNNAANRSVDLLVTAAPPAPVATLTGVGVANGRVSLTAVNGLPGCGCTLLGSPDVTAPRAAWTPAASGVFDDLGRFQFTAPMGAAPQQFFLLRQP